jgi:hypothetical protein
VPAKPKSATGKTRRTLLPASSAKSGDIIMVDSEKVGSPAREGEVLEILAGDVSVRYRVKWPDGHESLISPPAGSIRVVSKG